MLIGIIGAMEKEISGLRGQMEIAREDELAGVSFWQGTLYGAQVVLALSGIGKVHAAMCALGMIERFRPDALLNIGVAGGLTEELRIGDIVIADSAVQHDADTSPLGDPVGLVSGLPSVHIPCDSALSGRLEAAARREGLTFIRAAVTTGDQFIESIDKKLWLSQTFGAAACDMEGAAIAQVAFEARVPYAAYRAVSDTLRGNGLEYSINAGSAAAQSARLLRAFLTDII